MLFHGSIITSISLPINLSTAEHAGYYQTGSAPQRLDLEGSAALTYIPDTLRNTRGGASFVSLCEGRVQFFEAGRMSEDKLPQVVQVHETISRYIFGRAGAQKHLHFLSLDF